MDGIGDGDDMTTAAATMEAVGEGWRDGGDNDSGVGVSMVGWAGARGTTTNRCVGQKQKHRRTGAVPFSRVSDLTSDRSHPTRARVCVRCAELRCAGAVVLAGIVRRG